MSIGIAFGLSNNGGISYGFTLYPENGDTYGSTYSQSYVNRLIVHGNPGYLGPDISVTTKCNGTVQYQGIIPQSILKFAGTTFVPDSVGVINNPTGGISSSLFEMLLSPIPACADERQYTDQYLITLNGWDKLGNPVAFTKTVTLNGGTDYMPLGFSGQSNHAWLGGIDRATVRALNGSSKNGQLALYARVFKVSVDVFGILTDPIGTFFDNLLIGRFSLSECKAFGSPIAGNGFGLNSLGHYVFDLYLTAQGFTDTGLVCCDDESDEAERPLEGEPYAPPLPCDCDSINQYILQLQYRILILEGKYPLKGDKGDKGDAGPQGPQGIEGPQGIQGEKGDKGDKGDTGDTGPKGDKGDKGDAGATGPQGPQGPQGIHGQQGPQGIQGQAGIDGIDGSDGIDGEDGQNGWITEVEYMAIEDKLQGILDSLTCAERGIACILEKALLKTVDHPEAGEIELGVVDSVIDFEGKAVQQSIEEIEGVTIENEFRVQSRRTEDIPEEV